MPAHAPIGACACRAGGQNEQCSEKYLDRFHLSFSHLSWRNHAPVKFLNESKMITGTLVAEEDARPCLRTDLHWRSKRPQLTTQRKEP